MQRQHQDPIQKHQADTTSRPTIQGICTRARARAQDHTPPTIQRQAPAPEHPVPTSYTHGYKLQPTIQRLHATTYNLPSSAYTFWLNSGAAVRPHPTPRSSQPTPSTYRLTSSACILHPCLQPAADHPVPTFFHICSRWLYCSIRHCRTQWPGTGYLHQSTSRER